MGTDSQEPPHSHLLKSSLSQQTQQCRSSSCWLSSHRLSPPPLLWSTLPPLPTSGEPPPTVTPSPPPSTPAPPSWRYSYNILSWCSHHLRSRKQLPPDLQHPPDIQRR